MRIVTVVASGVVVAGVAFLAFLTTSRDQPAANDRDRVPVTFELTPPENIDPQTELDHVDQPTAVPVAPRLTPEDQARVDEERRSREATLPKLRRLRPDDVPELPKPVRVTLAGLGCTLPQHSPVNADRDNVLRGRFRSAGEKSWAIVCSRQNRSSLLLVTDAGQVVGDMDFGADIDHIESRDDILVWANPLRTVGPDYVKGANEGYGPITEDDRLPDRIDHDGVEEIYEEKGAVTMYWHDGRWRSVVSGD